MGKDPRVMFSGPSVLCQMVPSSARLVSLIVSLVCNTIHHVLLTVTCVT